MSRDLERIQAFWREVERRLCTRTEPFTYGTAYLNTDFPHRWDSNFLLVESSLEGVTADELAAEAERVLGHRFEHREVVTEDDAAGERLAPRFLELGWRLDHALTMVLRRPPDREAEPVAREVRFDEARPILEEVLRRSRSSSTPEVDRELVEFERLLEDRLGARFFVAETEGRLASICELYVIGGVAQVESVDTLEEFRGRGLARAVVQAAIRAARARDCDLVFIAADVDDWPQQLYGRLGFDAVSRDWTFRRPPPGAR